MVASWHPIAGQRFRLQKQAPVWHDTALGAFGHASLRYELEGETMNRTRGRLVVACVAVIGAAIAVAGGSAGNRNGIGTLEAVPGPGAVTYGENIAYKATFKNDSGSVFTQIQVRDAAAGRAGGGKHGGRSSRRPAARWSIAKTTR